MTQDLSLRFGCLPATDVLDEVSLLVTNLCTNKPLKLDPKLGCRKNLINPEHYN